MKIYVASSWRNQQQPELVRMLRAVGHETYDFRAPEPGSAGFSWSEIDPGWQEWKLGEFKEALNNPIAIGGFQRDVRALSKADACVLVLPCGRSAHLEAGYALGSATPLFIFVPVGMTEPELMYRWATWIGSDMADLIAALREQKRLLCPTPPEVHR